MELRDYLAALRRGWWIMVVCTLIGGLGAAAYTARQPAIYQTKTQLFLSVDTSGGQGLGLLARSASYVKSTVASYGVVVRTPSVLQPVIDQLGLDTTPRALAAQVSAVGIADTVVIEVNAISTDPQQAAVIADAVAGSLSEAIRNLETPPGTETPGITASIITNAPVPRVPIAPNGRMNLMYGLLLGFLIGFTLAILRHVLDTTVKTPADLMSGTKSNVLGLVPYDSSAKREPLTALKRGSTRAESFRTIRTNLQYVDVDNPPRVIVVTSPLPNDGKTTSACNLAITFAQAGSRVLLIEGDLRRPRVADYLGLEGSVGLTDVLVGRLPFSEAILGWRSLLDVLPSGPIPPNPSELLGSQQMATLLRDKAAHYDVILIDAPPLLPVTDAAVLTGIADGAILVARHGKTRREQVAAAADALQQVGARLLGVVMNFAPAHNRRGRYSYRYGYGYGYEYGDKNPKRGRLNPEDSEMLITPAGQRPQPKKTEEPAAAGSEPR